MDDPEIQIVSDRGALARNAATRFVSLARQAMDARGQFAVALSGGSTPRDLYALLATPEISAQVDWSRVHVFFGDERAVPPDHADSNFKMAHDALFARVPLPAENIHRIRAELAPDVAAREYENEMRAFFSPSPAERERLGMEVETPSPAERGRVGVGVLDLVLLGLGANGHTASLFPHARALRETERWVVAEYIAEVKMNRITLTAPVINAAATILWLVAGADKATTVREVMRGAFRPDELPAQLIRPPNASVVWLLDQAAASEL
ncbi:MAG: 6-phosphogluconolactonase [Chloroflexi bacterium]|nr:6-phosphogluconolactonase [Chloroflexota bacterium]